MPTAEMKNSAGPCVTNANNVKTKKKKLIYIFFSVAKCCYFFALK